MRKGTLQTGVPFCFLYELKTSLFIADIYWQNKSIVLALQEHSSEAART